jgi:glycosyltransferase involved in cell wall biosynthesis
MKQKTISIITPCYNEALSIENCYQALARLFDQELKRYKLEYIVCDNCSTDGTVNILENIAAADSRVKIIVNANNFGILRSMFNGLKNASGDAVVPFLPADLQDPPEILIQFAKFWEEGYKVIYGQRAKRNENKVLCLLRKAYYRFINRFSKMDIPVDAGEFQLLDRQVVDAVKKFDDYQPYLRGMIAACGFKSIGVPYTWKRREKGKSNLNLFNLVDHGLNGIVSTTIFPIRFAMSIGLLVSTASILFAIFNVFLYFFDKPMAAKGIMMLIVSVFFLGGVQLFFIALIGEYVGSIHSQVRRGPLVVEDRRINFD